MLAPKGKYLTVQLAFYCGGAGAYRREGHDVLHGERAFKFARQYAFGGALYTSGYRVCAKHAQEMGAAPDTGNARKDITVPICRELAGIRSRVECEFRAEKDPERRAIWAQVIMDVDKVAATVLYVNIYDQKKETARRPTRSSRS